VFSHGQYALKLALQITPLLHYRIIKLGIQQLLSIPGTHFNVDII